MIVKKFQDFRMVVNVCALRLQLRSTISVYSLLLTAILGTLQICGALNVTRTTFFKTTAAILIALSFTPDKVRSTTLLTTLSAFVMTNIFLLTLRPAFLDVDFAQI